MTADHITGKLENIISGHGINSDDAAWLRALAPQAPAEGDAVPDLYERLAEAHDASLDDDHRACRSILTECMSLLVRRPDVQPKGACQYCDGTGDVHSPDGEWRGVCTECPAGEAPDGAHEALQRLIENAASLGPARRDAARLVAKWRRPLLSPRAAKAPAPAPVAPMTWYDGPPPFPQDQEWFIAETIYGDKVALIALEEGRRKSMSWEFKTADGTYLKRESVKRWMQFPDCMYLPPAVEAPAVAAWQPIDTAPDGELVVVAWWESDETPHHDFDYQEDGCWQRWHDHAEHVEMIGGHGVSYTSPYTHWLPLPAIPYSSTPVQPTGERP